MGLGGSSAKGSYFGGRPAPVQPSAGRVWPDGAPRCAGVAEVMLRNRNTLSHAERRDGSDEWVVRAGSSTLGAACTRSSDVVQHSLPSVDDARVEQHDD